jgi:hypothetical protein
MISRRLPTGPTPPRLTEKISASLTGLTGDPPRGSSPVPAARPDPDGPAGLTRLTGLTGLAGLAGTVTAELIDALAGLALAGT